MMTVERVAAAMPDPVTQVINQAVLHRITVILIPRIRTTMLVAMPVAMPITMPVLTKTMLTKTRAVESAMNLQGMTFRMPVKLPLRVRTTQAVRVILWSRKQVVA